MKWQLGFAGAAGVLALLARSGYERKHFRVETYTIETDKIRKKERNLVFLSDLHSNHFGLENEELLAAIDRIGPDAVLIGGDMMVCKGVRETETALSLAKRLAERYPVFYGNGNHEQRMRREREVYGDLYPRYVRALRAAGVRYLSDASEYLGDDIRITGYDLDERYYRKFFVPPMKAEEIEAAVGAADGERFQILLAHSPLFFDAYGKWGADLALAGHYHGGTIRLPVLGGVMTPQYQFFLPFCAGEFEKEGRRMIVSRGLGTHSINIRINNLPQLVVVRLVRQTEAP